jgi:hypothetical protein
MFAAKDAALKRALRRAVPVKTTAAASPDTAAVVGIEPLNRPP